MFIHENFLLANDLAKNLFHNYAEKLPIIDYHCHLEPQEIAENVRFTSITALWLSGDHYKWRAMRACGIPEKNITDSGSDWEKFYAWAQTVERSLGNPLYHWTHLELKRYFGVTDLLNAESAKQIYDACNHYLAVHEVTAQSLILDSNVKYIGTTDDILSDLRYHKQIAAAGFPCTVAPSFRPDPVIAIEKVGFVPYIEKISEFSGDIISGFADLVNFLDGRLAYFTAVGGRVSDHGFTALVYAEATPDELDNIFQKAMANQTLTNHEIAQWQGQIMVALGKLYKRYDWVMQLHFGAVRIANTRLFELTGADTGGDSIYDQADLAIQLNRLLDALDKTNELPRTIIYNTNPAQNDMLVTTCANFQMNDDGIKSRVQFGAGWWFNDTYRGMTRQMESLADNGLLMNFVGMLTDSRSFLSYSRHDYFRRILANYMAEKTEKGFYPDDEALLKQMIQDISFYNAKAYFKLDQLD
ncbi:uronate isomerase [Lactococcus hodotermopsidis]|uniref:Uronate isomerase n=1 Tax=Pseudolactococcus hodotermopsidis TaxID=2709157 RepID=A0A6A0BCA1_9LACT|nr:glucuronate isomerase [Lactococcus hodotermopsidis]GFH42044.1 uronate isomerase [Lactococcus hodotermopsidis]